MQYSPVYLRGEYRHEFTPAANFCWLGNLITAADFSLLFPLVSFCLSSLQLFQSSTNANAKTKVTVTSLHTRGGNNSREGGGARKKKRSSLNWCVCLISTTARVEYLCGRACACAAERHTPSLTGPEILNGSSFIGRSQSELRWLGPPPHHHHPFSTKSWWRQQWLHPPLIGNGQEDTAWCDWFVVSKATKWQSYLLLNDKTRPDSPVR